MSFAVLAPIHRNMFHGSCRGAGIDFLALLRYPMGWLFSNFPYSFFGKSGSSLERKKTTGERRKKTVATKELQLS